MKKITFILCLTCIFISVIFSGKALYGEDKSPKQEGGNCISSTCHPTLGRETFVHMPVQERECGICHGASPEHRVNPNKYAFGKIKVISDVCFECHLRFQTGKFTHSPVRSGECLACHDPHGSPYKFLLIAQGGALCFSCHDEGIVSERYVHGPADAGGCLACHEPHSSKHMKNLRAASPNLCFTCHPEREREFREAKVVHKPAMEDCTNCHNPHSAAKQYMLAYDPPTLCFQCHKRKEEWVNNVNVKHGALVTGKSCLNCHEPHASNIAKRLSMAPLDLCLTCHDRRVKTYDGKLLTDMKKLLAENSEHHGPIKRKDCAGCHNPHGSNEFRILKEDYPSSFYMPFDIENYNLCFKCHLNTIVQDPETTKLTDFRNGETNLHYKHVNKPDKGRTCRACHETHASNNPKHIREKVPFGNWEFPLNFVKRETGGSCAPACHKEKKYDRIKKINNE